MAVRVFVEGIADRKFLKDYIQYKYNISYDDENIIVTGGRITMMSEGADGELIKNKMIQNSDNDEENILIFDADKNFKKRLKEITLWKEDQKLTFDIFLWPNHSLNGDLENLLENIINLENTPIFECWDNYEACLQSKIIKGRNIPLTTPARKTKIYGYLEALLGDANSEKKKIKETNRDYRNIEHWDLNSSFLNKLQIFLDKHFQ